MILFALMLATIVFEASDSIYSLFWKIIFWQLHFTTSTPKASLHYIIIGIITKLDIALSLSG